MNNDWNRNGRIDSFDRYVEYRASHSGNAEKSYDSNTEMFHRNSTQSPPISDRENVQDSSEDNQDNYLLVLASAIIGLISGIVSLILMLVR